MSKVQSIFKGTLWLSKRSECRDGNIHDRNGTIRNSPKWTFWSALETVAKDGRTFQTQAA